MKKTEWNDEARSFVRDLDDETKKKIGFLITVLQKGEILGMPASKPMKIIHPNAFELRVKDAKGAYRVIYVLAVKDMILIPHAFTKKTEKTPQKEIETSKKRLDELLRRVYEKAE